MKYKFLCWGKEYIFFKNGRWRGNGINYFFIHLTDASPKQGVDEGLILFSSVS